MAPDGLGAGTGLAWLAAAAVTALKATAILLLAMGIARLLRSRSAALRHLVWTAALAAALALPAVDAVLPAGARVPAVELPAAWTAAVPWTAPGASAASDGEAAGAARETARGGRVARDDVEAAPDRPEAAPGRSARGGSPASDGRPRAAADDGPAAERGDAGDAPAGPAGWAPAAGWLALFLWGAGAAVVLGRTVWGALRLARVRRRAEPLRDPGRARRAREASRALGGPSSPPVRVSPEVSVPLTCGLLRPTLLLPQEVLDEWPAGRTDAVVVHELAHVLRRDVATHVLARLACAAYWFHPLVWRAAREAARERERACDDVVLRAGVKASRYARHLLEIAREAAPARIAGGAGAVSVARRRDLEGRVLSILEDDAERSPPSRGAAAAALLPAAAVTAALAVLSVESAAPGPGPAGGQDAEAREAAEAGAPDVHGSLVEMLDDPDASARAAAAEAVGELRVRRAVPGLTRALEDASPEVRLEAARALGKIEDPGAVDALGRALTSGGSRKFRKVVAWALGETETPEAVEALGAALGRADDRWLRKRIARALGETRRPAAVDVLQGLLGEADRKLRRAALDALAENDTDRATAALAAALESDDAELRAMAARALGGRKRE